MLKLAIEAHKPVKPPPQHASSVEWWREQVEALVAGGAAPRAIFDRLRLEHAEFDGSLSAIKRLVATIVKERGIRAEDVAIPVDTLPGRVAQVDFGAVGSRHAFARIVFEKKVETWLALHVAAFE